MRAATGLEVNEFTGTDADRADLAAAARRLHRHAFHQRRVGVQLRIGDLAYHQRMGGGHQPGNAGGQHVLVQWVGHIEVQPRIVRRDRAAVHQLRHQMAQQMRGGVKPHQPVPPCPVHACRDHVTRNHLRGRGLLLI